MNITEEHLRAFFGRNATYYLEKWQQRQQGTRITFNASAFLGGLFWFAYRKMYRVLATLFLLLFAEAAFEEILFPGFDGQGRAIVGGLVVASLFGASGNFLYLRYAERRILHALQHQASEEEALVWLRRKGGISFKFLFVLAALPGLYLLLYWWIGNQTAR